MSELISGKEALIALANGEEVQGNIGFKWVDISIDQKLSIKSFTTETNDLGCAVKFRLKPRTITLNGIEVPAPFEPKEGDIYWHINPRYEKGYHFNDELDSFCQFGAWRTEEEIKQVVAALRQVFGGSHDN